MIISIGAPLHIIPPTYLLKQNIIRLEWSHNFEFVASAVTITMILKFALSFLVAYPFSAGASAANDTPNSLPLDDDHLECPLSTTTRELGDPSSCNYDSDCGCLSSCGPMDGYTGSYTINKNTTHCIWNFTLGPGESTGMHRHDYDYLFVVKSEAQHAIFGPSGEYINDFWSSGEIGFIVNGDQLVPTVDFMNIPRVHAAKNIGNTTYNGILYEFKKRTIGQCDAVDSDLMNSDGTENDTSDTSVSSIAAFGVIGITAAIFMVYV